MVSTNEVKEQLRNQKFNDEGLEEEKSSVGGRAKDIEIELVDMTSKDDGQLCRVEMPMDTKLLAKHDKCGNSVLSVEE